MYTGDILTEEVFSSLAIGYHRTHNIKTTTAIGQSGFKIGGRTMYGSGVYLTYTFDDQQDDRMKETYGPFVIRCKVNLADFLIFDPDIALRVYGPKAALEDQFSYFGVPKADVTRIMALTGSTYTSVAARSFALWLFSQTRKLMRPIKGLVFTGEQDGRVIVVYDAATVIPFAWARVIDLDKTRETVRWNKIINPPLTVAPTPMPEFERAYRFFRTQGFTVLSHGTGGASMMGVRDGDFLSIIITRYVSGTIVKAFCNRIDPLKTKLPGYAEHHGWPLYHKEFPPQSVTIPDTLPLRSILDTILTTHAAMKQRGESHVAFTETLLRHVMKPNVVIQREDKPGRDYRHDDIILNAGSVHVVLDSPYQNFTTGKLTIASKPVPLHLGFNDSSRRHGTANLAGAYASLIQMAGIERIYARLQWQWPDDLQPQFIADLLQAMKQH